MADNRTMAQMLQAPIEGYEDAIVVPPINANNFELKQPLINLVQKQTNFGHPEVPNTSVKLLLFPFSLDGEARDWLDKEPPRSILTWDDLVSKFINQYFPPSKTTYYRNEIITFYQKPNEAFNEAWERFKGLLRQCPHHGFSELHQLDTFYNSLNSNDQDALDSCQQWKNFLDKMPQEGLAIIESKSKVRYSRSRANDSRVSTDAPLSISSPSNNSFDMQQIAASLEDKMTIKMNQMMSQMKALVVTPAPVKAVEEVCVTCGSNHNFNNCPLTRGGNDFPVFHDNIQQFQQTAAIGNFLQRNQPSNLASQMRPPGFNQPNVQTNQNRYQGTNSNFNQNRGTNFNQNRPNNQTQNQVYQAPPYQTPTNQPPINQVLPYQPPTNSVLKTEFENYVKANDAVLKNVQNQNQGLQNQMANVTSLLTSLCDNFKNSASTSNSGTLPSQTVTNPRQQINAIPQNYKEAVRLWKNIRFLCSSPDVSKPQKEPKNPGDVNGKNAKSKFWKIPLMAISGGKKIPVFMELPKPKAKKTVNLDPNPNFIPIINFISERIEEFGLKDVLFEMPKFNKWLSSLLRNKEKLEEIAITTVNAECSAIIMNKVPEKLEDPGKFLIPSLTPTRMTLELANRSISHPLGIAEDVVEDPSFEPQSFIGLYEENLTLRVGKDELVYYADKSEKNNGNEFCSCILLPSFSNDDPFSGCPTTHSVILLLVLPPVKGLLGLDHEPEQNESSITFSPRSDPLHHEFAGEIITLPARNDREFEEYLSLMTVLHEISTSQGNFHQNSVNVSLPISPIPVEDSEPTQEEIDILLVPDDLIPPGVDDADSEDEVNESPNLDHQNDPSIPRPPPEPPDIEKCFAPKAGIVIIKEFKSVSKSHDFMTSILPTLVSDLPFISSIVSFENEDTIFDPGIVTFLRAGGIF
ncbi:reverse transcriptase domain-containing protein [Tanacetum coccineum]